MSTIPRRTFLKSAAITTAAAPFIFSSRSLYAAVGPNDKIRVGLIGCGGMGRGNLAAFLANAEVDCAVLCDVDDAQLKKASDAVEKQRGVRPDVIKDFRRAIDRKDVDAIIVATPDHWHALPTIYACEAGKDVYVEKPLATSIDEGRAMLDAARRYQAIVQMGAQRRSSTHCKEAIEFVRSGKLGKVGLVRGWAHLDWLGGVGNPADTEPPAGVDYDMWLGPAPKRPFNPNRFHFNFRWFWDYAGGLMTDWGVHLIDMLLYPMAVEHPKTISSTGGKFVLTDNSETPDTQVTVYEFPSYTMIWEHKVGTGLGINGRSWGMSWTGSEGTLILNDSGWEIIPEPKKKSLEAQQAKGSGDARPLHVQNFLECMRSRRQPTTNLDVAHYVSAIAHLGNISYRTGSKIVWDPVKERITNDRNADALLGVKYRKPWKLPYSRRA